MFITDFLTNFITSLFNKGGSIDGQNIPALKVVPTADAPALQGNSQPIASTAGHTTATDASAVVITNAPNSVTNYNANQQPLVSIGSNYLITTKYSSHKLNTETQKTINKLGETFEINDVTERFSKLQVKLEKIKEKLPTQKDYSEFIQPKTEVITESTNKKMQGTANSNNLFIAQDSSAIQMIGGKYTNIFMDSDGNSIMEGNGITNYYFGGAGQDRFDIRGGLKTVDKRSTHIIADFELGMDKIIVNQHDQRAIVPEKFKTSGTDKDIAAVYDDGTTVIVLIGVNHSHLKLDNISHE